MSEFNQSASLEADLSFADVMDAPDRYSFIRSVMANDELYSLKQGIHPEVTCSYMWDYTTQEGRVIMPAEADTIFMSETKFFTRLGQGNILDITGQSQPYLKANLSECSVLVARGEQGMTAAHLSFSTVQQMQAAMEHFASRGFAPEDMQVVASLGAGQKAHNYFNTHGNSQRMATISDYTRFGIPAENITPFAFSVDRDNLERNKGLCEVIAGLDGMLVTTFDADIAMQHGFVRETIHEDSVTEHFVPAL